MTRKRPAVLLVMGLLGLLVGINYLIWMIVSQQEVLFDLFFSGLGDPVSISHLARRHLASPVAVYATTVLFFLELVLILILLWTATGLMSLRPSARWAAVFFSIFMILIGITNVILGTFVLVPPNQQVNLQPLLVRGGIILFAIILWGTMFMPSVIAAYSYVPPSDVLDEYEPEPPPSSRRRRSVPPDEQES
jgi:hypothetical protein